ncbi:MAG: hypothetical protein KAY65_16300, partial [Planctomycetes bacterium]|nr:hypothetical protein [Planctomycetota bacterium]
HSQLQIYVLDYSAADLRCSFRQSSIVYNYKRLWLSVKQNLAFFGLFTGLASRIVITLQLLIIMIGCLWPISKVFPAILQISQIIPLIVRVQYRTIELSKPQELGANASSTFAMSTQK